MDQTKASTSFICSTARLDRALPTRTRTALESIESILCLPTGARAVTPAERLTLWNALSEWASQNIAAIEGGIYDRAEAAPAG